MTLRKKTLFLIGLTLIGLMVALYVTSATILMSSFAELEKQNTSRNVERVRRALYNDLDNLNFKAADWAVWDDTYHFIDDANEAYVKSNLVASAFSELRLNLMLFIHSSGRIVFGRGFDLKSKKITPIPESLKEHLSASSTLLQHPDIKSTLTGIILLPEYPPLLIVSRPILTSKGKGHIRGSVIFGRYLDAAEIKRLAQLTQLSLTVHWFKEAQMLPDFHAAHSSLSEKSPIHVRPLSANSIAGYTVLSDIYKKPALLLRVTLPRVIYQQGQATMRYLVFSLLTVGLVFGVATLLLLEKGVLSRLTRLSASVGSIGSSGNSSARVSLVGSDELSSLAITINGMLEALENSQHELRRAHDELEMRVRERTAELVKANQQIQHQICRLDALHAVDMAITASMDIRVTFNVVLDNIVTQLGADAAVILLLNPHMQTLEYASGRGLRSNALQHTVLPLGEGNAGRAAIERRIVSIPNLAEVDNFRCAPLMEGEAFIAYYGVPLIAKGHVKGVLEIFYRTPFDPDREWLDFLEAVALQAAIAIDNAAMFEDLQRSNVELTLAYNTTIEGLSYALDLRDKETEGHSQRVTNITLRLARIIGFRDSELVHIRRGALLHDIGKIGIPDKILLKPGPLTEEDWEIMRKHPVYAYELLSPISFLRPALDIPYCHHEKWDGTGYPQGLKGEQIPLAARVFAVVDVWESLLSDRSYRPAWPKEKVREYICSLTGTHFDPKVVKQFFEIKW